MTTAISDGRRRVRHPEFTAVLAFSMALTALGIDLMLPAFGQIRADLGLPSDSTAAADRRSRRSWSGSQRCCRRTRC